EAAELLAATADTTGCRIFNFTYTDNANAAYKLGVRTDVEKLRLHWSDHPHKNAGLYRFDPETGRVEIKDKTYSFPPASRFVTDGRSRSPWYAAECVRRADPRDVAMNLDIDPQGSMYQFFDRHKVVAYADAVCEPPYLEGDLEFDPHTGMPTGFVR